MVPTNPLKPSEHLECPLMKQILNKKDQNPIVNFILEMLHKKEKENGNGNNKSRVLAHWKNNTRISLHKCGFKSQYRTG